MENTVREFLFDEGKRLFISGHIEVRNHDKTPARHVTGWLNKQELAINSSWLDFLADAMAKKVIERTSQPLHTIVLSHDNYQADTFAAMLAAKLSNKPNFNNVQAATMTMSFNPPHHTITMNEHGYKAAQRIIIADVASFTLHTLHQLAQSVRHDRGSAMPEIIIACAMRLFYEDAQPPTATVLKKLSTIIGCEIPMKQFGRIQRCELCKGGRPLTHVFDPKNGLRVYNAEAEAREREAEELRIKILREIDEEYQKRFRAGEHPKPPMRTF
jgi:hypothetical protein